MCASPRSTCCSGGQPDAVPELARLASPVFHVDPTDPPLFVMHGDQDNQIPVSQSLELKGAYENCGLFVQFAVVHGAGHGGPGFTSETTLASIDRFLRTHLSVDR